MGLFFGTMGLSIAVTFGYVFYMAANALPWLFVCIFFLGLGGANFAMYTLWLPEQYTTDCRASAIAFVSSVGRFVGVGMVFLVGRHLVLRHARHAGRADVDRVRARVVVVALGRGNARQAAAGVISITRSAWLETGPG